ncbi:hypothetical protein CCAX7_001770 [Capsulimonas corticalis]|uniref:Uncharacterized protein n=1 Tax=Capsulimonas corticalis TaxID=2219043 RepID=A0A402CS03_9BACT|nr:redoxin domain-containing protein [Capsulimonas corticalis]BDI28126.1 hypothetical protein CCAX7_001770 [Capsulimonas corticalis]
MNTRHLAAACALAALPFTLTAACHADAPDASAAPAAVDPKALALLDAVDAATKGAKALTADFTVTSSFEPGKSMMQEGWLKYLKPNYLRADTWQVAKDAATGKWTRTGSPFVTASDGKKFWIVVQNGEYHEFPADPSGKGLGGGSYPGPSFFDAGRSLSAQLEEQQQKHLLISLAYGGKQTWEGADYQVIDWVAKPAFDFGPEQSKKAPNGVVLYTQHLYVGSDNLVHREVYDYNVGLTGERALRNIALNPLLTAKSFHYTLPAGAHPPKPAPEAPPVLANGAAAPDFVATTPEGASVLLSNYRGKTVVLDFWATWCGPCQASMPHLNKVYDQVKDKDVVVLAVCVWDDKDSYAKWVTEHKTTYAFPTVFDPAGKAGKNIAGALYRVSGIPTQFVIDKDGKVAASNVGYMGESDHRLEGELAKLGVDIAVPASANS